MSAVKMLQNQKEWYVKLIILVAIGVLHHSHVHRKCFTVLQHNTSYILSTFSVQVAKEITACMPLMLDEVLEDSAAVIAWEEFFTYSSYCYMGFFDK